MLETPIHITGISSLSAQSYDVNEVNSANSSTDHNLKLKEFGNDTFWVGELPKTKQDEINKLRNSELKYRSLDKSVLYAIYTARKALQQAGWSKKGDFGINIGSSRGATEHFESFYSKFLETGTTSTLTSPTTTLGNISSWVAHDLQGKGPVISHSITCSTALHALLNGIAWIQGGLSEKFIVGGSEAPLTAFTIAQMKALKIYSENRNDLSAPNYPCRALDLEKKENTMVLGEGAAMVCLEKENSEKALARIIGIGYATEILQHNVSISSDAQCFQDSMKMALGKIPPEEIDAIVLHAPGTIKGDLAEYKAIEKVFPRTRPFLTSNKWKIGHTFGASGMLSIETGIWMLLRQKPFLIPFIENQNQPNKFDKILVNAVGFGGNAVSILLSK